MWSDIFDNIITSISKNKKKYLGCFLGFVIGCLLVSVGIGKTIFVIFLTFIGYCVGADTGIFSKLKDLISNLLNNDR